MLHVSLRATREFKGPSWEFHRGENPRQKISAGSRDFAKCYSAIIAIRWRRTIEHRGHLRAAYSLSLTKAYDSSLAFSTRNSTPHCIYTSTRASGISRTDCRFFSRFRRPLNVISRVFLITAAFALDAFDKKTSFYLYCSSYVGRRQIDAFSTKCSKQTQPTRSRPLSLIFPALSLFSLFFT